MRAIVSTLSILVLAVAAQTAASAQGHAPAVSEVVLCMGGQAVSIGVDAEGKPVTHGGHDCPDCIFHFAALVARPAAAHPPQAVLTSAFAASGAFAALAPLPVNLRARGPPVSA